MIAARLTRDKVIPLRSGYGLGLARCVDGQRLLGVVMAVKNAYYERPEYGVRLSPASAPSAVA